MNSILQQSSIVHFKNISVKQHKRGCSFGEDASCIAELMRGNKYNYSSFFIKNFEREVIKWQF